MSFQWSNNVCFTEGQNRLLKDELEQLKARSTSDARLQQKLQQDLINLEKVRINLLASEQTSMG